MKLAVEIYNLTKKLPKDEMYGLSNQMRRAAISIPSNIAEGHARKSTKEYINFLSIAQGSKAELDTQLLLSIELNYLTESETAPILNLLYEISKMITTLSQNLTDLL